MLIIRTIPGSQEIFSRERLIATPKYPLRITEKGGVSKEILEKTGDDVARLRRALENNFARI
jgi:hypothetical protein